MANNRFVLDTSAIFTLIEDEEGASRVELVLKKKRGPDLLGIPDGNDVYISTGKRGGNCYEPLCHAEANRRNNCMEYR